MSFLFVYVLLSFLFLFLAIILVFLRKKELMNIFQENYSANKNDIKNNFSFYLDDYLNLDTKHNNHKIFIKYIYYTFLYFLNKIYFYIKNIYNKILFYWVKVLFFFNSFFMKMYDKTRKKLMYYDLNHKEMLSVIKKNKIKQAKRNKNNLDQNKKDEDNTDFQEQSNSIQDLIIEKKETKKYENIIYDEFLEKKD